MMEQDTTANAQLLVNTISTHSSEFSESSYPNGYAHKFLFTHAQKVLPAQLYQMFKENTLYELTDAVMQATVEEWADLTHNSESELFLDLADAWCVLNNITLPPRRRRLWQ